MAEYIEREAAVKHLCETYDGFSAMTPSYYNGFMNAVYHVKNTVPSADVAPVVHGRWIEKQEPLSWSEDDVDLFWECSACVTRTCAESPYCPNCGAKMDGE